MSRITDFAASDFLPTKDDGFIPITALHDLANAVRAECWENTKALGEMASKLTAALEDVPVYNPQTGRSEITRASRAAARSVGGYLRRGATAQIGSATEAASAWGQVVTPTPAAAAPPPAKPHSGGFRGIPQPGQKP